MKFVYEWRELTDDGLLKTLIDPPDYMSWESLSSYNEYEEFTTEESAIDAMINYSTQCRFLVPRSIMLVKIFKP